MAPEFWTPERVSLLGTAPDETIGQLLGISTYRVCNARRKHGIPPCFKPWQFTEAQVAQLGTRPDQELAALWGCPTHCVASARSGRSIPAFQEQRRWTAAEIALLGTMSDAAVAQRVGRSKAAVAATRRFHGVSGASKSLPHPHLEDIKREYTTTLAAVPEIATRYGVSNRFIINKAGKRGWRRPDKADPAHALPEGPQ